MKMKKYLLAIYVFSALFLHSQQAFADLIATCYGSQNEYVKCKGNPDVSSVVVSRGTLIMNSAVLPPSANVIVGMSTSLTSSEAKFTVMTLNSASLGQTLFFECVIKSGENYPLFQTASTIISASSTGLDSENSYYTKNDLLITRDAQDKQRCTNIRYNKTWVR